ncbi:MAG: RNA methyltransferase [Bacilli bacterium]
MLITSTDNDKIKEYSKLKERKYRDQTGEFLIEGPHLIAEAYRAGIVKELILEQDAVLPLNAPTIYVTKDIINKLSEVEAPTNVMALCRKMETKEDIGKKILILDGIQDPGNLGTIIRSSKAFHIDTIVLGENTVDVYNPKVIRATQGMIFHINIIKKEIEPFLLSLKQLDIPIYGTKVEYGKDFRTLKNKDKDTFALIMGNEGNGIRSEVLDLCDSYFYIEMAPDVESLNVGVAASIILYELDRRD